jgi:hypothetical protein
MTHQAKGQQPEQRPTHPSYVEDENKRKQEVEGRGGQQAKNGLGRFARRPTLTIQALF